MKVNGKEISFQEGISLEEFLESQSYDINRVAVECNGKIVPRDNYSKHELNNEDAYEIVVFVGGG
jgi:thiamine biosynthesis protein ThiS